MEREGWSVRLPHPRNRRSSVLELTAEGRRVHAEAAGVFEREAQTLLGDPLSEAEREQLSGLLRRLRSVVEQGDR